MTKEEALKVLTKMRAWRRWGKEQNEEERPEMPEQKEVDEAFNVCIEMLSRLPLSFNLDEVVEKEIERFCSDMLNVEIIWARMPLTKRFGLQMAKFGAEWMAGQGITVEGDIEGNWRNKEDAPYEIYVTSDCLPKDTEFKFGDKVVVQIRKK